MKNKRYKAADLFCGAGGTSTGLIEACQELGINLDLTAINHWDIAIETHSENHPQVNHLCTNLDEVNPRKLYSMGQLKFLWASPECMSHSIARGGKPINDQSRSTAFKVLDWAEALQPEIIMVENVPEFRKWGPIGANGKMLKSKKGMIFDAWIKSLEAFGYKVDHKILCAADYGDPTTRKRLFVQAVRGHKKIAWPEPTHASPETLASGQADLFGKKQLKPWIPARDIIDWTIKSRSIFDRKKPLSEKTMKRIWVGLERFGFKPFIVPGQSEKDGQQPRTHDIDEPTPTVTAQGHMHVVEPYLIATDQTGGKSDCVNTLDDPLTTVVSKQRHAVIQPFLIRYQGQSGPESIDDPVSGLTTRQKHSLINPFLVKLRGTNVGSSIDGPVHTISTGGNHALAEPFLVQVAHGDGKTDGSNRRVRSLDETFPTQCGKGEFALVEPSLLPQQSAGRLRPVSEPAPTIAGAGAVGFVQPYLVKFYGNSDAASIDKPLDSLTTKERFALVRPIVVIEGEEYILDIHFRMLQPRELAVAQGFPKNYKFKGKKTKIVKQIGNAVPKNLAKALCKAVLAQTLQPSVRKKAA